ncbi:8-amino-7-oxononanoate synthase [Bacillus sp. DNRA2]|uniref:8-amino-7-oxononanoate synthase n=1 Tax=Bacillus sp. DNRA2 TaxID=2723053 RepID=UPI00145FC49F|nr:8-amino-7-oxononanoate synthase [Bacillus sp. DNRA2]
MELDSWLKERLHQTIDSGLYRTLRTMTSAPGPQMVVEDLRQLVFSSNNYLGLANDQRLIYAAEEILYEFGVGSSGSRLTTGHTRWHQKLEQQIAQFKQTEAALLFSSGYLANVGVLSAIPEKGDVILSDRLNHASLIDGCRLSGAETVVYEHVDMSDLEEKLHAAQTYQHRFIVTDGVFSMDGNIAPLDQIMKLAKRYNAFVIVDDAHATGVLGEHGRGTSEHFNVQPDIVIGTLSKAVGTEGGFVCGSQVLIDFLKNHARTFIFQTAIPAAICAASYVAFEIMEHDQDRRQQLLAKAENIRSGLQEMGFTIKGEGTPIIPVIIGDPYSAASFANKLQNEGVFAPAIRPPTVEWAESRIRLTVTSEHHASDIEYLLATFYKIGKELKII